MDIIKNLAENNSDLADRLTAIAYERSIAFCYHCYTKAIHTADGYRCPQCFSDDLARLLDGVGVEWGISWVVDHIVTQDVTEADFDNYFSEYVSELYGECKIGWLAYDVATAIKELDPISYKIAMEELADSLASDGELVITDSGAYYWVVDIEEAFRSSF